MVSNINVQLDLGGIIKITTTLLQVINVHITDDPQIKAEGTQELGQNFSKKPSIQT